MDHMPPAFVKAVGDQWPRYVIRDAIAQSWTGSRWSTNPSEAALFYSEIDAIAARNRIGLSGDEADTFTATIALTVYKDEWTAEELIGYLRRHRKSFLRGPAGKCGILLELVPDGLKKVASSGEQNDESA